MNTSPRTRLRPSIGRRESRTSKYRLAERNSWRTPRGPAYPSLLGHTTGQTQSSIVIGIQRRRLVVQEMGGVHRRWNRLKRQRRLGKVEAIRKIAGGSEGVSVGRRGS